MLMTLPPPIQINARKLKWRVNSNGETTEPLHPRAAAVDLQGDFRSIARQLAPRDKSTQDDLVQEMTLGTLLCHTPQTRSTYRMLAAWRATDYLRWWTFPLRKQSRENYNPDEQPAEPESKEISEFGAKLCAVLNIPENNP